jgi:hypothetical protein
LQRVKKCGRDLHQLAADAVCPIRVRHSRSPSIFSALLAPKRQPQLAALEKESQDGKFG